MLIKQQDFDAANNVAVNLCGKFLSVTIEIADNYMVDTLNILEKMPIFKQEVKQLAHECRYENPDGSGKRGILAITSRIRNRVPQQDIYTAYVDNCLAHVKKDIQFLYLTILQRMTADNVPHRDMLARMEVARILLFMSANAFKECFDQIRTQCNIVSQWTEFQNHFADYYIGPVAENWDRLFTLVNEKLHSPGRCNLNDSPDIIRSYNILLRRYTEANFLDDGAEDTITEFHDFFEQEAAKCP